MVEGGGLHGYDGICELCQKIQQAYQTKKNTKDLVVRKGLGCIVAHTFKLGAFSFNQR